MARQAGRRKLSLWARLVLGAGLLVLALAAAGIGLRYWIATEPGRAFLAAQLDGRRIGALGSLRVSGLKGDPLSAAQLADIALVDDQDVWLRAKDAVIRWTPSALFGGELRIEDIRIRTVDVMRQPRLTPQKDEGPPPDIGFSIGSFAIEDLHLSPAILGIDAHYEITAAAAGGRDRDGHARVSLRPLSGPPDSAEMTASWSARKGLSALASLSGPPGGLIASLLQAPPGEAVSASGRLEGSLTDFTGSARLALGDREAATLALSRRGDAGQASASISLERWPLLAAASARLGKRVAIEGRANLADLSRTVLDLSLMTASGGLDLRAPVNLQTGGLKGPVQIKARRLDLRSLAPPLAGHLDAEGELTLSLPGRAEWKGQATGTGIAWPSGSAARVSTPLVLALEGRRLSWETPSVVIEDGRLDALPSLQAARYSASTRGEFSLRTQTIDIHQAQLAGAAGEASARGSYSIGTGAIDMKGALRLARLAEATAFSGSGRAQWAVRRTAAAAPIRIRLEGHGRNVSSPISSLAALTGPEPRIRLTGILEADRFTLESGSLEGKGVRAGMSGRISDTGRITAHATGSLLRPLALPGATINSLALSASISGDIDRPLVELRLSDGAIASGGLELENLSGRGEGRIGKEIAGDFRVTGTSGAEALSVAGRLRAGEGEWRILDAEAMLGRLRLRAPLIAYADSVVSLDFNVNGPLSGLAGIEGGSISAKGVLSAGEAIRADISGRLSDVHSGAMRLDLLTFNASAAGDKALLAARGRGAFGAPVDLELKASGVRTGTSWSGEADINGEIDQLPVRATRPAGWRITPGAWSLEAGLAALDGRLDAVAASSPENASARISLAGINLRALTRLVRIAPTEGRVTGSASFVNRSGQANGDLRIDIAGANPVGVTADPVSLVLSGQLRNRLLTLAASGGGQGFTLTAAARQTLIIGEGFDLRPDAGAPLSAQLDMTGRAEQPWALFGPADQSLQGELQTSVRIDGTLSKPVLSGGFSIARGAYEHDESGVRLREIAARGAFDQDKLRITGLSASDGSGGRLSGEGAISWRDDLSGGLVFTASSFRALGREDRMAVVSGKGSIQLGPAATSVTGDLTLEQARISVEQPASAAVPTLAGVRRINFPDRPDEEVPVTRAWLKPVDLNVRVSALRRVIVFGRGLDTEWSGDVRISGPIDDPSINGTARLVRGDLDLAGRRFAFDTGTIDLKGPVRLARVDISARRAAADVTARVHVTGTPVEPKFTLESTPALPEDEILARIVFGRSAAQLSGFEAAQLAAGLARLAGGQAGFDPVDLVRRTTGLDRFSFGSDQGAAKVSAGKYIAEDVYLEIGAGGTGGVGAEVEWEPQKNLSITSSAQGNGDTKISVRWKKDY